MSGATKIHNSPAGVGVVFAKLVGNDAIQFDCTDGPPHRLLRLSLPPLAHNELENPSHRPYSTAAATRPIKKEGVFLEEPHNENNSVFDSNQGRMGKTRRFRSCGALVNPWRLFSSAAAS